MPRFVLFGVVADTLEEARVRVEHAIGSTLVGREGLHAGGVHYTLGFPIILLDLKNNIDLDDTEMEFNGLSEPEFPEFPFLLYLNDVQNHPEIYDNISARSDQFKLLRSR